MKKNFKVIQLNGIAGFIIILLAIVTISGSLFILPIYGVKFLWNEFANGYFNLPTIRLAQASLLWFAVLATAYGYIKKRVCFKFVNMGDFPENNINQMDYDKFMEKIKEEQQNDEKINR